MARICNIPNWYFERVVFPGQRLVFEAPILAQMEIHTGMMASAILSDTIPCDRLALTEPDIANSDTDLTTVIDPINPKPLSNSINTKIGDTTIPLQAVSLATIE